MYLGGNRRWVPLMIMMISEEKVAEFKEQDDSLKNLVYWLKTN